MLNKPFYHFSIDDIFQELIELRKYEDPFNHPLFAYLKELNNKFDIHVTFYIFFSGLIDGGEKSLVDVTDKHRTIFQNTHWLHFAPHALNYETAPFNQNPKETQEVFKNTYREIERFAGSSDAKFVRLHYFSELYELADFFKSKGVTHLFTRDKREPSSWRLPSEKIKELEVSGVTEFNGLGFIRSHLRLEFEGPNRTEEKPYDIIMGTVENYLSSHHFFTFFTHNIELKGDVQQKTKQYIEEILLHLHKKNIRPIY